MSMSAQRAPVIIAAVDGSDAGLRAVDYAVAEARLSDASLVIAHVVDQHALLEIPVPASRRQALLTAGHGAAEAGRRRAAASGFPATKITVEVTVGRPAEMLAALSKDAGQMVVGRRDLGGVERLFAGSTSIALAARTSCPLIIVPQAWDQAEISARPAGVAVGIDGARESLPVLRAAFETASARRAELTVIYAWEPPTFNVAGVAEYQDTLTEWTQLADLQIAEVIAGFTSDYPDVVVHRRFERENPVAALITASMDAELLLLGVRGRSATSGLRVGGVARAVIAGADCPLALVSKSPADRRSREAPEENDVGVHAS
jgi:nucleotide-binding universal stress UspA family protein